MLDGQIDGKGRAGIGFAVHLDKTAVIVHHAVNHRQTQAGPFAALLRGKKRLEDVRLYLPAHATSGIAHADARVVLCGRASERFGQFRTGSHRGLQGEHSAVFHRVTRVDAKIQQHLMNLAAVRGDQGEIGLQDAARN